MQQTLNLQITIFTLLVVGFFCKRTGMVSDEGKKNITDLVLYLVLPCNILTSFSVGVGEDTFQDCLALFLISAATQAFCVLYGKFVWQKKPEQRKKCLCYGTICSNAGFLGNPVAEGLFGATGLMYASVYLIPLRVMMWSEGIATFSGEKNRKATIKKVLTHPCVIACILGILLLAGNVTLPTIIATPLTTIGRCNTALSMLVIGMILAEIDPQMFVNKDVIWYTVNRLFLIPLVVYFACALLPVSETVRGISVLLAAMPAGATTSMLAAKYECDPQFGTALVVFSTLCSAPAILLWSMVL